MLVMLGGLVLDMMCCGKGGLLTLVMLDLG